MAEALFDSVARFYDYETENFVGALNDVPFYIDFAKKCKGEVLELACGTGRVLIPLAKEKIKVTGLDASSEMLKIAKSKIGKLSKNVAQLIDIVQGDMSQFDLRKRFSLIFITFRSFQHLATKEAQGACLNCVNKHLDSSGFFILHLFAPRHDLLAKVRRSVYLGKLYDREYGLYITRRAEDEYDLAKQTLKEDRFYEWTDKAGTFHQHVWSFELGYLFRYEAELLLEKYGFKVKNVFGDFKKSSYNYYSGEQIFVARKR